MDVLFLLRKVLNRFRKADFEIVLPEWGFVVIGEEGLHLDFNRATKAVIVSRITEYCKRKNITLDDVAELDLIYNHWHQNNRNWQVYRLTGAEGMKKDAPIVPPDFEFTLRKQLSFYFRHDLHMMKKEDWIWLRICLKEGVGSEFSLNNVVYIMHPSDSLNVFTSTIKKSYKQYLLQALVLSLHCTKIKELELTGRHLRSLADMVLHQHSQGVMSRYRYNQVDESPLSCFRKRKESPPDISDDRLICENTKEKRARLSQTQETFGQNKQPVVQKLTYKLVTGFHANEYVPGMADGDTNVFHCTVKFAGTSVIEGIRQLGPAGLAKLPLPSHLGNIHSLAKNCMIISEGNH
ncbi:centromere protein N-A-like [Saccoglossus kowalevskii]|uniref:Centromere protein N-A-like isoform X2 n=1 Tax=Saccoglossus kowalevskii TaxID=10224 RepID=A0ABM0MPA5_SACKO|nr:PREDICTED: centromere protein N-A-like isoform X2 [Saccoglossus kowalevskii]